MALIASSSPSSSFLSNDQVQAILVQHVEKVMLGVGSETAFVKIGPLATNNFSFTNEISLNNDRSLKKSVL